MFTAGEHAGEAGEHERHEPQVVAEARRPHRAAQRHVAGPPAVGGAVGGEEAGQHRDAPEEEEPVAEGVEPGERHVGRADVQRHEVVRQPERERPDEQEQHHAAVHREQLVVAAGVDHLEAGRLQLGPDQLGQRAADEEEDERGHHVGDADALVVGARQEGEQSGGRGVARGSAASGRAVGEDRHDPASRWSASHRSKSAAAPPAR